ncbi:MiaB/RimO family radical SAM methylthiotransferase [Desulfoferula mesophila]|uniref:tRNA (N(6)-L-threonylcarbamoyladenosine(37)-C(2) )-methylthiotransferase MtaB n=1 Tax=Desulfoferula mesophila TaxID=3058419 RepID=A0AAU9EDG5_9BACT|nr:tRNA (N(6)-L-threonylcarbamoyladenosine(37)-C(2))-methylthiotransferase MtaB [Desulfoferula mesophilus]
MKRYTVASLGCKVNQAEAAHLAGQMRERGWLAAGDGQAVDLALLFTCSVTGVAARQSRQMARRLRRAHPGARVVVTGCDVQAEPQAYSQAGCEVLGRAALAQGAEALSGSSLDQATALPAPDAGGFCPGAQAPGPERTRGLLKVQDGCNAHCAYCIVPSTRGRSRSLPLDQAAGAFAELGRSGTAEVVLTGIHLGRWGWDFTPRQELAELLRALLAAHPAPRLRLSSLESEELTPEIIELAAAEPRLVPHFHLPLQTGSARLLKQMGRPYGPEDYARTVRVAAAALPGLCLGADVLVGLPGESDQDFEQTRGLLAGLPISYLHVFPYSSRPGTRAADMADHPAPEVSKERAAVLRELGLAKKRAYYQAQVGSSQEVIVEGSGLGRGANYCLVRLAKETPAGNRLRVNITGCEELDGQPLLVGAF